jgi:hypothetical protein
LEGLKLFVLGGYNRAKFISIACRQISDYFKNGFLKKTLLFVTRLFEDVVILKWLPFQKSFCLKFEPFGLEINVTFSN